MERPVLSRIHSIRGNTRTPSYYIEPLCPTICIRFDLPPSSFVDIRAMELYDECSLLLPPQKKVMK